MFLMKLLGVVNEMIIHDLNSYIPEEGQRYFFDCNVLMYLFYSNGSYACDLIADYSAFLSRIINQKAEIIITDVLVSEFINTYIQTEFHRLAKINHWPSNKRYFKSVFKLSDEYSDILNEIRLILERQLFPISKKENVDFEHISLVNIFDTPATFDFNDRYYDLSMKDKDTFIVTNDADFSDVCACAVITRNTSLLSKG